MLTSQSSDGDQRHLLSLAGNIEEVNTFGKKKKENEKSRSWDIISDPKIMEDIIINSIQVTTKDSP